MTRDDDLQRLLLAVHALTRIAALDTQNDAPAAQWRTLTLLRDHGPQRLGDLATLSRISQPGMTRLVHQMDAAGLVARAAHPGDSRVSVVAATEAGLEALERWYEQFRAALSPHVADLSADEWEAVGVAAAALSSRVGMAPHPSVAAAASPASESPSGSVQISKKQKEAVR
ncbi:DNA-binding transcriptional regulator, MarR family [Microbacterium sp. ru370.1]|uniref:MarR family winged helix-turn-helix transcriptional regulator n=1 Tax=unclassified Microbacterium TaxID=2609290 RepID=UPI00088F4FCF|nr:MULTISPECIES: MarR family transcriptional regulator [unclassified Microbacterium]SDO82015.1 DNA-binding transcriptional regulator, MarR family [Microbacterium sp. ru370.1]SIT89903.1 DNA-binding transcriptional regulator, MarR family [Microbacterium sp. RU1D]